MGQILHGSAKTTHVVRDCKGARHQRPQHANRARRRGDRIEMLFAAVHESAFGTKRTTHPHPRLSAFGATADITSAIRRECYFSRNTNVL